MSTSLDIVVLGLSITSSWGNGHATNYRALAKAMHRRGHRVLFLERDVPWYAERRDFRASPWVECALYSGVEEARDRWSERVRAADLVVLGSFVPEGRRVADWVLETAGGATAFYDLDTPVTLAQLASAQHDHLAPAQVPRFDLYLSFSGGEVLDVLRRVHGARRPIAFYCCVDEDVHRPLDEELCWDLGYLGTYCASRQRALDRLMLGAARRRPGDAFVVAGSCYPSDTRWPINVERIEHVAPPEHARFYCRQRFTLNVTRRDMVSAGWSPSVRLFEAAACGVPAISDAWPGLGEIFRVGEEILVSRSTQQTLGLLAETSELTRRRIGARARERVLAEHTAMRRIETLEASLDEVAGARASRPRAPRRAGSPR